MYWSTIFMIGSFVFSAARINSRTRPRVVSWPARGTLISSTPVRFCVPANTSSPGFLSTGSDSPVILAWLNEPCPLMMTPSAATLSPGRMRITSPTANSFAATSSSSPRAVVRRALVGGGLVAADLRLARGKGSEHGDGDQFVNAENAAFDVLDGGGDDGPAHGHGAEHGAQARHHAALGKNPFHEEGVGDKNHSGNHLPQTHRDVFVIGVRGVVGVR